MTATKDLENDHEYIIRLTNVMEQMIIDYSTNKEHFETVVSLIRNFADDFITPRKKKYFSRNL
jgi:hemerythrin-like domain-containing protein